jgi:hypothetical protein
MSSGGAVVYALERLRNEDEDTLVIVGGDSVVPFCRLRNPIRGRSVDPDEDVLSDNPYGVAKESRSGRGKDVFTPTLSVGRIPDDEPPALQSFIGRIQQAINPARAPGGGVFALTNRAWERKAWAVLEGMSPIVRSCPGWNGTDPEWCANRSSLLYFKLHGFDDKTKWQGFDSRSGRFVDGLSPAQVTESASRGRLVFTENCYGALIESRCPRTSIALAFLEARARAVVGATTLAFGSYLDGASLGLADVLAKRFIGYVMEGESFGRALARARIDFVESSDTRGMTTFDQKTALQFVLFGNPLTTL